VYIPLKKKIKEDDVLTEYEKFYEKEPFVRIYKGGKLPEIKDVIYTNFCDIGMKVTGDTLVVVSCIDNLLKGASGQAVQNMNILCGFKETEGLI